jgi:hypothetical protein
VARGSSSHLSDLTSGARLGRGWQGAALHPLLMAKLRVPLEEWHVPLSEEQLFNRLLQALVAPRPVDVAHEAGAARVGRHRGPFY